MELHHNIITLKIVEELENVKKQLIQVTEHRDKLLEQIRSIKHSFTKPNKKNDVIIIREKNTSLSPSVKERREAELI